MDVFLDFLKNNVLLLVILGLIVILLIIAFLVFPKRFNKYWSALLEVLPVFVADCEKLGIVGGEKKLNYVLDLACSYLAALSGFKVSFVQEKYSELIKLQIEQILAAPHKKEEI